MATTTYTRAAHLQDRRVGLLLDRRGIGPRVAARRLEPQGPLDKLIARAQAVVRTLVLANHGGGANSHNYRAMTDAWLLAAYPDGTGIALGARVPANKVTFPKAAAAAVADLGAGLSPTARTAFDGRFDEARQVASRAELADALQPILATGLADPQGCAVVVVDGVRVDRWMLDREPWEWEIGAEPDAEARRIMIEMVGFDRYLTHQGGHVVHEDETGKLWARGAEYGVQVRCPSTGREYFLFVPPTVTTAREAVAWTFGIQAREYRPDQES